jgi:flagellar protein FlbD
MITLSRINGLQVMVNPDLIRFIECIPDTVLTFIDGEKLIVREKPSDIVERIVVYRRSCRDLSLER